MLGGAVNPSQPAAGALDVRGPRREDPCSPPGSDGEITTMASVNKVILIGRLGRDPELRYTQGGQAVANFTLATNERFANKSGEQQERTEWHRIVAWGKTGELCAQYLSKGRSVYIEGRLQTRDWEDKEGQKRSTTEIVAQNVTFLDSARTAASGGASPEPQREPATPPASDEIPF